MEKNIYYAMLTAAITLGSIGSVEAMDDQKAKGSPVPKHMTVKPTPGTPELRAQFEQEIAAAGLTPKRKEMTLTAMIAEERDRQQEAGNIALANARAKAVERENEGLIARAAKLKKEVSDLLKRLDLSVETNTTNEQQISTLTAKRKELEAQIVLNETTIADLRGQAQAAEVRAETLQTELDQKEQDHDTTVAALNNSLQTVRDELAALTESATGDAAQQAKLEAQIKDLESKVVEAEKEGLARIREAMKDLREAHKERRRHESQVAVLKAELKAERASIEAISKLLPDMSALQATEAAPSSSSSSSSSAGKAKSRFAALQSTKRE